MNSRQFKMLACCALALSLAACSPTIRRPRLLHPGPAGYQRANAEEFDPYPLNDVGPEIVGGRPLDYQVPVDEVTRARMQDPIGPLVSPGPFVAPPAVPITGPIAPLPVAVPMAAPPITMPPPVPTPMVRY